MHLELDQAEQLLGFQEIKKKRLNQISRSIQIKIYELQNIPRSKCNKAQKIICRTQSSFGSSEIFNEILWCLLFSNYYNKTLLLNSESNFDFNDKHIRNNKQNEIFESFLKPISITCDYKNIQNEILEEVPKRSKKSERKIMDQMLEHTENSLLKLIDRPIFWFHSQFIGYIMRPQPLLIKHIEHLKYRMNYSHPIVGINFRGSLHIQIDEFMIHVNDYYEKLELTKILDEKLVYLASDGRKNLSDFTTKYREYRFISGLEIFDEVSNNEPKSSEFSLLNFLTDIFLLSETDYVVCESSSIVSFLSDQSFYINEYF
jgi:glycoprotein 6-alpha-L-fucosyltransferase